MTERFKFDVFLSHSNEDKLVVRELAERVKAYGLRVWFDEWQIRPADMILIPQKIDEGLEVSRILLLAMSKAAFGSEWANLESGTFRFRHKHRRFIRLRPRAIC